MQGTSSSCLHGSRHPAQLVLPLTLRKAGWAPGRIGGLGPRLGPRQPPDRFWVLVAHPPHRQVCAGQERLWRQRRVGGPVPLSSKVRVQCGQGGAHTGLPARADRAAGPGAHAHAALPLVDVPARARTADPPRAVRAADAEVLDPDAPIARGVDAGDQVGPRVRQPGALCAARLGSQRRRRPAPGQAFCALWWQSAVGAQGYHLLSCCPRQTCSRHCSTGGRCVAATGP